MRQLICLVLISMVMGHFAHAQGICGFDQSNKRLFEKFPQLKKQAALNEQQLSAIIKKKKAVGPSRRTDGIFEIPVVVHILHTGDTVGSKYNPSTQQILEALDYLNQVYSGTHPSLTPEGVDAAGDIGLRFVLVKRDPDCNPTDGIHRVNMAQNQDYIEEGARSNDVDYDIDLKTPIAWDPSQYYNIYVVNKINGLDGSSGQFIAGFAYLPTASIVDGIVMLASQMKSNSKTLAHEIGHAFNLFHPFEGSNRVDVCPTATNDEVDDTDPISYNMDAAGVVNFTCRRGANSCNNDADFNIRTENNFMNYTNCFTLFTPGQKERIQASMNLPERVSFINSPTLLATYEGDELACPAKINFEIDSVELGGAPVTSDGCRKYRDYHFYLTIGNDPGTTAVASLKVESPTDITEGIDFDFIGGKNVSFPGGSHERRQFTLRVYDFGKRDTRKRLTLGFTVNSAGGTAQVGTASPAMHIGLKPVNISPVISGTVQTFDIGTADRVVTDALLFNASMQMQRTQVLYKAGELLAAGLQAGKITGLSFLINKKTSSGFQNIRIKLANTTTAQLVNDGAVTAATNLQEVAYLPQYTTVDGWNTFNFTTAFQWNGTDNICVELCFDNGTTVTSAGVDEVQMYSDGSASDIANMMGAENTNCSGNFNSVSYYSAGVKPVIKFKYVLPGNPVASALGNADTEYLGPYGETFFYDQSNPKKIIASVKNLTNWNYGCVNFTIDRSGNNTTPFWNYRAENSLTNKTFFVTAERENLNGQYEVTLFYTEDEKRVYELASRNNWQNVEMIKTTVPVKDITPVDPQYDKVEIKNPVQHSSFGVDYTLTAKFTSGFSGFSAGIVTNAALPVTWLDFTANYKDGSVIVDWQTATETNNQYFVVEVSSDGTHFDGVYQRAGMGNTTTTNSYQFIHQTPPVGLVYYRIKQLDFDGQYSYSNVVQVMVPVSGNSKAAIYPVPANDYAVVNFGRNMLNVVVQVVSNDGKLVYNEKLTGLYSQKRIPLTGLAKGMYMVKLVEANNSVVLRFIKN